MGSGHDPEVAARRAVDSMRLDGPAAASLRSAETYLVGMPMWMWVTPSPNTFGPVTASATAGGITVTATAPVSSVRWDMGGGKIVTCAGPDTRCTPGQAKTPPPTCGHLYERAAYDQPDERCKGSATTTGTVEWSAPAVGDAGTLTETRSQVRGPSGCGRRCVVTGRPGMPRPKTQGLSEGGDVA
ncbi:ATP/GTP-binding protein [Streptomyces sp. NPDC058664]|uniref:ATP/GTP-binding protein n=1 Tax=unclassified Streptomyces TaxID=2593676 RepID=UPI00364DE59B